MPFQGFPLSKLRTFKKKEKKRIRGLGFSLQEELQKAGEEKCFPKRKVLELGAGSGRAGCVAQPHSAL